MKKVRLADVAGFYLANALALALVSLAFGGAFWIAGTNRSDAQELILAGGISWYVGWFFAVFIHELGHVIGGHRAGMKFRQMAVGPIAYSRGEGRPEIFLSRRTGFGGFAFMALPDWGEAAPILRRFVLGGPTASLALSALLAIDFAVSLRFPLGPGRVVASMALLASLTLLTGTLVPYSARGMQTAKNRGKH